VHHRLQRPSSDPFQRGTPTKLWIQQLTGPTSTPGSSNSTAWDHKHQLQIWSGMEKGQSCTLQIDTSYVTFVSISSIPHRYKDLFYTMPREEQWNIWIITKIGFQFWHNWGYKQSSLKPWKPTSYSTQEGARSNIQYPSQKSTVVHNL
jgi:hypothetical protein